MKTNKKRKVKLTKHRINYYETPRTSTCMKSLIEFSFKLTKVEINYYEPPRTPTRMESLIEFSFYYGFEKRLNLAHAYSMS